MTSAIDEMEQILHEMRADEEDTRERTDRRIAELEEKLTKLRELTRDLETGT